MRTYRQMGKAGVHVLEDAVWRLGRFDDARGGVRALLGDRLWPLYTSIAFTTLDGWLWQDFAVVHRSLRFNLRGESDHEE